MSDIVPRQIGREGRQIGRELARMQGQSLIRREEIEGQVNTQTDRLKGVAYVGTQAMNEASMVIEHQQLLTRVVPESAPVLDLIAATTGMALAQIVQDTAHKLRG